MKILLFVMMAVLSTILQADPADPIYGDIEEDQFIPRKGSNQQPQKLNIDGMPVYPDDSNLRKLNIRQSKSIFYVDISSIRSSTKDNIARMVIVAISTHGARTVTYEGFDCGYRRYQAYGYAGSEGPLRPFEDQDWKPVIDHGNGRYRATLIDDYVCAGFAYVASREKILARMQNLKPLTLSTK